VTLDADERSSFLATATDSVRRAGQLQRDAFGGTFRIDKKGTIDLVTEVDVAVERMIRALIAERHPTHAVLGEELGGPATAAGAIWMCDPIDGTTNFAHGLPVFCSSIALEVDGELEVGRLRKPDGLADLASLAGNAVAELFEHVGDHHPDHDLVLDEKHRTAFRPCRHHDGILAYPVIKVRKKLLLVQRQHGPEVLLAGRSGRSPAAIFRALTPGPTNGSRTRNLNSQEVLP